MFRLQDFIYGTYKIFVPENFIMIGFWVRLGVLFILACLQLAIVSVFDTTLFSINILLLLVLAWTLALGFSRALGWILFGGFIFDIFFFFPVGMFMAIFVFMAYAMSTLTRGFLVAHALWGKVFIAGVIFLATMFEGVSRLGIVWVSYGGAQYLASREWGSLMQEWIFVSGIHIILFAIVFMGVSRLEKYLAFYERRVKPKNYA